MEILEIKNKLIHKINKMDAILYNIKVIINTIKT